MDEKEWKDFRPHIEHVLGMRAANDIQKNIELCEAAAKRCEMVGTDGVLNSYNDLDMVFKFFQHKAKTEGRDPVKIMEHIDGTYTYVQNLIADTLVSYCSCKPVTYKRAERPVAAGLVK